MKYIVGALFSMLILGLVACGNDGNGSSVFVRKNIRYGEDFNMYKGSPKGAEFVKLDTVPSQNKDSLFRSLTLYGYLSTFKKQIEDENKISFEFMEGSRLVYTDFSKKIKIISNYIYRGDSLFVLKDGVEEVFVAVKEKEGNGFFRTKSVMRKIIWNANTVKPVMDTTVNVPARLIDLDLALEFAEIANSASMTNTRDTLVWNNMKYIYEQ